MRPALGNIFDVDESRGLLDCNYKGPSADRVAL
jgi:hypothetical protein